MKKETKKSILFYASSALDVYKRQGCKDAPSQQPPYRCPQRRSEPAELPTQDLPESPVKAFLIPPEMCIRDRLTPHGKGVRR